MCVFSKHAFAVKRRRCPFASAFFQFFFRYVHGDFLQVRVDRHHIAFSEQSDRSARLRFRRDVADDEAVRATREPSVSQKGNGFAHAFPHEDC